MPVPEKTIWCSGCGVEITWSPIRIGKDPYCCWDCAEARPCDCGERMELDEDRWTGETIEKTGPWHPGNF